MELKKDEDAVTIPRKSKKFASSISPLSNFAVGEVRYWKERYICYENSLIRKISWFCNPSGLSD
jgi:hypothetical protein